MKEFSIIKTAEALAMIGRHVDEELLLRNGILLPIFFICLNHHGWIEIYLSI